MAVTRSRLALIESELEECFERLIFWSGDGFSSVYVVEYILREWKVKHWGVIFTYWFPYVPNRKSSNEIKNYIYRWLCRHIIKTWNEGGFISAKIVLSDCYTVHAPYFADVIKSLGKNVVGF